MRSVMNLKWQNFSLKDVRYISGPTFLFLPSNSYMTLMLQNTVNAMHPKPVTQNEERYINAIIKVGQIILSISVIQNYNFLLLYYIAFYFALILKLRQVRKISKTQTQVTCTGQSLVKLTIVDSTLQEEEDDEAPAPGRSVVPIEVTPQFVAIRIYSEEG